MGNFLGVSLCYFSWLAQERHPDSVVVSVDPNIPHRGIKNPQAHTLALLHHFDLLSNNLLVPGYSLERNLDEGAPTDVRDVRGLGCEQVLRSLGRLTEQRFDLVVLDGNHDGAYLSREFEALRDLLSGTAIVVFDDVSERWDGVVEVFRRALEDESTVELGQDGRVGILGVRAGSPRDLQSATPS